MCAIRSDLYFVYHFFCEFKLVCLARRGATRGKREEPEAHCLRFWGVMLLSAWLLQDSVASSLCLVNDAVELEFQSFGIGFR